MSDLTPGQYYDLGHQAAEILAGHVTAEEATDLAHGCREGAKPQLAHWWRGLAAALGDADD